MRTFLPTLVCSLMLVLPSVAHAATLIAIFPESATDPNLSVPLAAPVSYTPTCGLVPKYVEPMPVNPITTFADAVYDDFPDTTKDCRVSFYQQILALPRGFTYKVAAKTDADGFVYSAFSSPFALAAQAAHECDGTDPTSGTVLAGTRTFTWCYPDNQTGGSPLTGFALYTGTVRTLMTVTTGTANAAGRRAYTATVAWTPGTLQLQVAPLNAVGEGNRSPVFTMSVQAPATAPTGTPGIRGAN